METGSLREEVSRRSFLSGFHTVLWSEGMTFGSPRRGGRGTACSGADGGETRAVGLTGDSPVCEGRRSGNVNDKRTQR